MEIAIMWGWMLVAQPVNVDIEPFVDPSFKASEEQKCLDERDRMMAEFPDKRVWCIPSWKPDTAPKVKKVAKKRTTKKPVAKKTTRYRTARR